MKICLINNLYAPFARGGAETAVEGYAKLLAAAGHEIFIITTLPRDKTAPASSDKIFYLGGMSSVYFHLGRLPVFLRFIWQLANLFNLVGYFRIKKILAKEKPDLVMTHNLMGVGFLTPLAIKRLKIRHFHFLHDIQLLHPSGLLIYGKEKLIESLGAKIYQSAAGRLFGSPEKIISPSAWLLGEHVSRGYFKTSEKLVLPNPFPDSGLTTKDSPTNSEKKNFGFIYVGQIENHKGVLFLAETFAGLNSASAELTIIGDGSQTEALKKITGANQNIRFLGRIKREEVLAAMSQADCLVVPSLCYENSPSVIFEAFMVGLPVIASSLGGISELINDRNFLFKPADSQDLQNKLVWAINQSGQLRFLSQKNKTKLLSAPQIIERLKLA
jgi:glycosyltransferase involved in cell wall biosynthesis